MNFRTVHSVRCAISSCALMILLVQAAVAQQGWGIQLRGDINRLIGVSFSDPMNGYAAGYGTVLKTTDGGQTWAEVFPEHLFNVGNQAVFTTAPDTVFALAGLLFQIRRSYDGGQNWEAFDLQSGFYQTLDVSSSGTMLVGGESDDGNGVILRSADNGKTWTEVFSHPNSAFTKVQFVGEQTAWAVGAGVYAKSEDHGAEWEALQWTGENPVLRDVFFLDQDTGWILDAVGNVHGTRNGGADWDSLARIPAQVSRVWFTSANDGWITTWRRIFGTSDGGATWSQVRPLPTGITQNGGSMETLHFVNPSLGWAVGGDWDGSNGVIAHFNQQSSVSIASEAPPRSSSLDIYPNPMRHAASIHFALDRASDVRLDVYDILGRHVSTLAETAASPGDHRITWQRGKLGPGFYLVRLATGSSQSTAKAIVLE